MSEPRAKPLHPDAALRLIESFDAAPEVEMVALGQAAGRALAADLPALVDQPPFDKSAMDGFAYGEAGRQTGPGNAWRVVELVPAGVGPTRALGLGECARIMTGAPLPAGARGVQRVEWTEPAGESLVRFAKPESIDNIIRRAENQKAGDPLLGPRILQAQDIGILASSGYARVPVARRPVVAILSTGDELAAPGSPLRPSAIYNSNGPLLAAAATACGCVVHDYGVVRDEPGELDAIVARALEECDVLIASGGVSLGDFDYVPRSLEAAGVRRVFHGLAMRPGKPTFFGTRDRKAAFGLPGNPVSVFVNFEILVKAHLYRRLGLRYAPPLVAARLTAPLARKGSDRVELLPARLETAGGATLATPLAYRGSSMLNVFADANCLLRMELGEDRIEAGRMLLARLLWA